MEIINPDIEAYCEAHSDDESLLLKEINRDTHVNVLMPRMLSGNLQGRFLSMIAKMIRPSRILEIGTFTGYSALCMAEGLAKDGEIDTIDINEELKERVNAFFEKSTYQRQINYHIGNALELIPNLDFMYDLVFIDADKINYQKYYDMVFDKVNSGGYILIDNVLWSGKVLGQPFIKKVDKDTQAIIDFNTFVKHDARVEEVMLTIRDGLLLVRKKE